MTGRFAGISMGREIPAERRIGRCACARIWGRRTGPRVPAIAAGIPLLLLLLSLPRLTRPSVLRFDDNGIAYSHDGSSTVVPWTDISAVGIAFEIPVDTPSIDLSGILADKLVYDVLKVNKSRKISLEIFPTLPKGAVRPARLTMTLTAQDLRDHDVNFMIAATGRADRR